MLYPSIFSENLFDDLMDFDFPVFKGFGDVDKKLYGKHAAKMMKTDVHEQDNEYENENDINNEKGNMKYLEKYIACAENTNIKAIILENNNDISNEDSSEEAFLEISKII